MSISSLYKYAPSIVTVVLRLRVLKDNKILQFFFLSVLVGGLSYSIAKLGIGFEDIQPPYLLLLFFIFAPINLLLAAYVISLSANMLDKSIATKDSFFISAIAAFSEILPLPGGGIVRGAALVKLGAGIKESAWVVSINALMTLGLIFIIAAIPFLWLNSALGIVFFMMGIILSVLVFLWMKKNTTKALMWKSLIVRLVIMLVSLLRLQAAFHLIGFDIEWQTLLFFQLTIAMSSAVSIAPAGLGLSEILAAALALYIEMDPASAFVAIALDRMIGLLFAGLVSAYAIKKLKFSMKES